MNDIELNELFQRAVHFSKGTRIQRFSKSPKKLIFSKSLELISLWLRKPIQVKAKTFWKEHMFVIFPELVSLSIYRYGLHEAGLTQLILNYLKPGMIFFDVGAHFGYFTMLASHIVGSNGQVHTFEPTLSSFNILKSNVLSKPNVISNNCAVFSKKKTVTINDYGIKYVAFNSLYTARLPQDILPNLKTKKYKVQSITVDEYVRDNGAVPNFIKIDAEGSEYAILSGAQKTIENYHPMISIEVGDMSGKSIRNVPTSKELIHFLLDKGYQPYEFRERKIAQHGLQNKPYQHGNILLLPTQ